MSEALVAKTLLAMRKYLGAIGRVPARSEQRFYDRLLSLVGEVSSSSGVDMEQVWDQCEAQARKLGIIRVQPGKDY